MYIHLRKLNLRNHLVLAIFACMILCFQSTQAIGQEVEKNEPVILVLEREKGDFWLVDPFTGERDLLVSYDIELGQILDFIVDTQQGAIFILEGPGCCGGLVAGDSRISRVNWHTGEVDVVLEQRNMVGLDRIPSSKQLWMTYYSPEEESISIAARDGLDRHCLLNVESHECVDLYEENEYWGVVWVGQDNFIAIPGRPYNYDFQYLVDIENGTGVQLPVGSLSWVEVPFENGIIGVSNHSPLTFSIVNLETLETRLVVPQPQDYEGTSAVVAVWSFSPDGSFLVFRQDQNLRIMRFPSGEIVATLSSSFAHAPLWIDNENLVYVYTEMQQSFPAELRRYNIVLNESHSLSSFDTPFEMTAIYDASLFAGNSIQ